MVEGHQCHRVAHAHRRLLLGKAFKATSPNGRFADGAKAINGKVLSRIEVHGKNLFYMFGKEPDYEVMHIHFGMAGAFRTMAWPGRDPTETTRLRLEHESSELVAHLSAMTVKHGTMELYEEQTAKLGPDPLRDDADKELLWAKMTKSKKPIGLVLMDQSFVAGLGNIYRAEVLYKAGLHPEQPANTLSRDTFEQVWEHSVDLLRRGFLSGSIITVDPEDALALGKPWTRRYIYNHSHCGRCKTPVKTWSMAARTVYCCPTCQPLREGGDISVQRKAAMAGAKAAKVFTSHCAPDEPAAAAPATLTVQQLRARLKALNLDTTGAKDALVTRLVAAQAWLGTGDEMQGTEDEADEEQQGQQGQQQQQQAEEQTQGAAAAAEGSTPKRQWRKPKAADASKAAEAAGAAAAGEAAASLSPATPAAAVGRVRGRTKASVVASLAAGAAAAQAAAAAASAAGGVAGRDVPSSSGDAVDAAEARLTKSMAAPGELMAAVSEATHDIATPPPAARKGRGKRTTADGVKVASAREAAAEKLAAGENLAVEHVALQDDETDALIEAARGSPPARKRTRAPRSATSAPAGAEDMAAASPATKRQRARKAGQ